MRGEPVEMFRAVMDRMEPPQKIDAMLQAARQAGAFGGKVCGAGGGGCLFCIGDPERIPAIRDALASAGAQILEFHIERDGLRLDTRRTE